MSTRLLRLHFFGEDHWRQYPWKQQHIVDSGDVDATIAAAFLQGRSLEGLPIEAITHRRWWRHRRVSCGCISSGKITGGCNHGSNNTSLVVEMSTHLLRLHFLSEDHWRLYPWKQQIVGSGDTCSHLLRLHFFWEGH